MQHKFASEADELFEEAIEHVEEVANESSYDLSIA